MDPKRHRPTFPHGYLTDAKKSAISKANEMGAKYANGWMRMKIAITLKMQELGVPQDEITAAIEGIREADFTAFNKMIDKVIKK